MTRLTSVARAGILSAFLAASGATAAEFEIAIAIAKMKFGPAPAKLKVGDVIVWRNDDIFRHTATARDKSFDIDLPPKSESRMTIGEAGAIDFYCRFHPAMTGKLEVRP
jgi:plastocyanin